MLCRTVYTVIMQLLRVKLSRDSGDGESGSVVCWRVEDVRSGRRDGAAGCGMGVGGGGLK